MCRLVASLYRFTRIHFTNFIEVVMPDFDLSLIPDNERNVMEQHAELLQLGIHVGPQSHRCGRKK